MRTPLFENATPGVRLKRPLVIAHRGASGLAPENTLAAFRLAARLGADGVELDVHLSAEGVPIVIHDKRVNRTTNSRGSVSRRTVQELQRLDAGTWFERRLLRRPRTRAMTRRLTASSFAGEPLPTLEDALALFESAALERIYIELKGYVASRETLLDRVLSLVRRSRLYSSVTLLSFDQRSFGALRRSTAGFARQLRLQQAGGGWFLLGRLFVPPKMRESMKSR